MLAIQNAVRRFFSIQGLISVKNALVRVSHWQPKRIEPAKEPYVEQDDPEDRFAAWEADRAEKLYKAADFEQQGIRLLAQAALLRASVKCDDRGETFIASELRELADDMPITDSMSAAAWERPVLRIVGVDDSPLQRGA